MRDKASETDMLNFSSEKVIFAGLAKMVYAEDLKSSGGDTISVQVRYPAPFAVLAVYSSNLINV